MSKKLTNVASFLLQLLLVFVYLCFQKAEASTPIAQEFWISTNATGNFYTSGASGTIDSPLDGSSQVNFDSNMNSLPANSTIHILAGTYQTLGNDAYIGGGFFVKTGQKVLGSGIDVTILQLVHNAPDQSAIVCSSSSVGVTNCEVSDLTCDGNYTSGSFTYLGVIMDGTENAVRRVKVINLPKFGGNSEAWGIAVANGPFGDSEGNIIEECEVSHFAGGAGISSIAFANCSGIIRNNRVFLPVYNDGLFAFNGSWIHDVLIEGNYVVGGAVGVYGDTGGATNVTIINNTFKGCLRGVAINQVGRNNMTIAYNNFLLATNSDSFNHNDAIFFYSSVLSTNINIIGNHVGVDGAPGAGIAYHFLFIYSIQGLVVAYNTVDPNFVNEIYSCANTHIDNNYDSSGNYLSSLNVPTLGITPVTSFGLSLVGSAGASPALTALGLPSNPLTIVTNSSTQPITFNTNLTVAGNIIESTGRAYVYNGQNLAYAITSLGDYFFGDAGNFTMTGNNNIASGYGALSADTTGFDNTANGWEALYYNTNGNFNTANGTQALYNNTSGTYNTANGTGALGDNTTGDFNTAVGTSALSRMTTGGANTAIGEETLYYNTNGSWNTASGGWALNLNTAGSGNTANGMFALYSNIIGNFNIALGYEAAYNITTGSSNIDIGNLGVSTDNNLIRIGTGQSDAFIAGIIHGNGSGLTGITAAQVGAAATNQVPKNFVSFEYGLTNVNYFISTNHGLPAQPQMLRWVLVCKTAELGYQVGDEVSADALVNNGDNSKHVSEGANSTQVFFTFSAGNMQLPNKTSPAAPVTLSSAGSIISNWKLKCYATYFP